mgnify:CR=1 FL=1
MSIQNTKLTNFQADSCRVTVLAENKNPVTNIISLYSAEVSIPDEGISLPIGTIKSSAREVTNVFDSTGSFTAQTTQNEIIQDRNASVGFADDMVYISKDGNVGVEINKNMLVAMLEGNSFKDGSDIIKVVGTNGTRLIEPASSGQDFKYFAFVDGKLIKPQTDDGTGKPQLVANTYVSGYNNYAVCVMLEFLQSFDSNTRTGYKFAYVLGSGTQFAENSDYNKFSVECQFLADARNIDKFVIDGHSEPQDVKGAPTETTNINKIGLNSGNVHLIGVDVAVTAITLTNGTAGDLVVCVNETSGATQVFQITAPTVATEIDADYNLEEGCLIYSTKFLASQTGGTLVLDASTPASNKTYLAIASAGATGVAVATDFDLSATKQFYLEIKDFNFADSSFINYN